MERRNIHLCIFPPVHFSNFYFFICYYQTFSNNESAQLWAGLPASRKTIVCFLTMKALNYGQVYLPVERL